MKKATLLKRTFATLLIGLISLTATAWEKFYQSMAMYIPAETVEAIESPQERAAAQLFKARFGTFGKFITPSHIADIDVAKYDCIWVIIDHVDKLQGVANFPEAYRRADFIAALKKFHEDGGNLYLSKYASELLYSDGIGRVPDHLRPNVFSSGAGGDNRDIWSVNAEIGAFVKDMSAGSARYLDRSGHALYDGLTTLPSNGWTFEKDPSYDTHLYSVFPMQGNSGFDAIHREDHNCMWRLASKTGANAKVGVYIGYEGVHSYEEIDKVENPQERAALDFILNPEGYVQTMRPDVKIEVICPGDIERITDHNNFDCIWIHIDRCGLSQGWTNLPEAFRRDDLLNALRDYARDGGQLLLTKQATQLLPAIGRVEDRFAPNIFASGDGGEGTDVWQVNAQIGYNWHISDPAVYFDRRSHAIYSGMERQERIEGEHQLDVFPLLGTADGSAMWREDHNCMWDLNAIDFRGEGGNKMVLFQSQTNSRILGTWGHVVDDAVAGIVEFRPTDAYRGRIIANGLAAYEWAPRSGVNGYTSNIEMLTFNCLRYLVTVTDYEFLSPGVDGVECFESDANAIVLGTWGQDWNHQAAGIVEFRPAVSAVACAPVATGTVEERNVGKAPAGTIIANGIACVQHFQADGNNDYQSNIDLLTENAIQYLSPWHSKNVSGVEDVAADASLSSLSLRADGGEIHWEGADEPVMLEVYALDGRKLMSLQISGSGSASCPVSGPVVVNAGSHVAKLIVR